MGHSRTLTKHSQRSSEPWQVAAILVLGVAVIGAWWHTRKLSADAPVECYMAVDVSNSNAPRLDSEFALMELALEQELPAKVKLTTWSFGNYSVARKSYSGTPTGVTSIWELEKMLTNSVVSSEIGTDPVTALEAFRRETERLPDNGCLVCFLLWDGEMSANVQKLKVCVESLADDPKLIAVVCIGVVPDKGIRSKVERVFGGLGDKLIVCGPCDREEINRLSDLIKVH